MPLYYTLTPAELRLDRDTLEEEFFRVVDEAGVASIEELNRLLDKAEKLKAVLKAPDRVDRIAAHIALHYRENVEPRGFKGFVVAVDREGCALYKQALDRYLPEDYTQVVYTGSHKDDDLLRQHHLDETEEKRVRKAFRDPDQLPKILIVTQKLLTGYDAPVLYAMYLDKPLKDHTLLQAIARVNRPHPGKESGLIVDYIGVFENLQRALAFEGETITKGLINLEELKIRFADGEQVEDVIRRLRERQISVQAALEQMTALTGDTVAAEAEQAESDLQNGEFALYWVLKGQGIAAPKKTARQVHAVLDSHPGWAYNPKVKSTVRLQLYKVLSPQVGQRVRRSVIGEEPGPMSAQARRAAALKVTVDALLRMNKVVS